VRATETILEVIHATFLPTWLRCSERSTQLVQELGSDDRNDIFFTTVYMILLIARHH
jgi:hypothetical protein